MCIAPFKASSERGRDVAPQESVARTLRHKSKNVLQRPGRGDKHRRPKFHPTETLGKKMRIQAHSDHLIRSACSSLESWTKSSVK